MNVETLTAKSPLLASATSPVVKDAPTHTVIVVRAPDSEKLANTIDNYNCLRTCGILLSIAALVTVIVVIVLQNQS